MTISNPTQAQTFLGNGATTAFNFSFIGVSAANVFVLYTAANGVQTLLQQGVDYSVTINAPAAGQLWGQGGTITYPLMGSPMPNGASIYAYRLIAIEQLYTISNQGDFYAQVVEQALDTLCLEIQQTAVVASKALMYNPEDPGPFTPLPNGASVRANQLLGFDSTGALTLLQGIPAGGVISAAMAPVVAASTIAAAVTLLGINISLAMQPVVAASSISAAVGLLGLSLGNIIPCNWAITGTAINLTRMSGTNAVASETTGVFFCFTVAANHTGPFSLTESTDGLAGATLTDVLGNNVLSLAAGQTCIVTWNPISATWALVSPQPQTTATFAQFLTSGTWTCPQGITRIYVTICGGGGGGGAGAAASSGGGGGGGAGANVKAPINVTPGTIYTITVATGGTGGSGAAGGSGGTSTLRDPVLGIIASAAGGSGGAYGNSGSDAAGGGAGGSGGVAGGSGHYASGAGLSFSGYGGGCLLGAGGSATPSSASPGQTPSQFGGGGAGGANNAGGAGAPGYVLIEW